MKMKLFSAVLLSTSLLVACGGEENPDVEACEHLKDGPAASINASTTATGGPEVKSDHRRYDIALFDITGGKGGTVTFAAAEATDYVFFTNVDAPVVFKDSSGATVAIEETVKSSTECTDIKGRFTVPMKVGTHTITFGPTGATSISVIVEEGTHDHD